MRNGRGTRRSAACRPVQGTPAAHPPLEPAPRPIAWDRPRPGHLEMAQLRRRAHRRIAVHDRHRQPSPRHLARGSRRQCGGSPACVARQGGDRRRGACSCARRSRRGPRGGGEAVAVTKTVSRTTVRPGGRRVCPARGAFVWTTVLSTLLGNSDQTPAASPEMRGAPAASASGRATSTPLLEPPSNLAVDAGQHGGRRIHATQTTRRPSACALSAAADGAASRNGLRIFEMSIRRPEIRVSSFSGLSLEV